MGSASSASHKHRRSHVWRSGVSNSDRNRPIRIEGEERSRTAGIVYDARQATGDGRADDVHQGDPKGYKRIQTSLKDSELKTYKKSEEWSRNERLKSNERRLNSIQEEQLMMSSEEKVIKDLQEQVRKLQVQLKERDDVIRSLERQLNNTRRGHEEQVTGVKQSVEMVIKEKDSEIRRLKALWTPNELLHADVVDAAMVSEISRATKLLDAPEVGKQHARFGISAENRSSSSKILRNESKVLPKTAEEVSFIRNALNKNVFLKGLNSGQVDQLIDCMSRKVFTESSLVVTEGDFGTHLFVLERGKVEVFHSKDGERDHVIDLQPGVIFGELAILYNCKRTASVRAETEVALWCLERQDFQAIVKKSGQNKQTEYVRLLKTVQKLKSLPESKLMRIADCLEEATFSKGEYIIRQGDSGDTFYIIQKGKVKVTHTKSPVGKKKKIYSEEFVCHLEKGKYFGESALLTEEKRSANIVADSLTVQVLMLDRQAFNSLVGSIADINRNNLDQESSDEALTTEDSESLHQLSIRDEEEEEWTDDEEENLDEVDGISSSGSTRVTNRFSRAIAEKIKAAPLEKLNTIQVLGQGGFGCVKLVSVPGLSQHAFALKAIRKARIIKSGQQQHILAEKNILMEMRSNFIGRLHRTYKDELRVYLLMDAYLGGDVYGILKKVGPLSDMIARFYAGCVLEALEYLHLRGIVYRDMKPENLMLDHRGYVKLVDFGFAKRLRYGYKTYTFCGTPEYFPPEILSNTGHDFAADYWSYGILIYELLTRNTPFYASDDMTVYENILGGLEGVRFPKRISRIAEILIRGLCKLEPRDRLGYQRGGIGDIRKQRWFQGFDWMGLRNGRVPPPFDPDVRSATDTRNFEHVKEKPFDKNEDRKLIKNANMAWDFTF